MSWSSKHLLFLVMLIFLLCEFYNHHVPDVPRVRNIGIPNYGRILFWDFPKSPINEYNITIHINQKVGSKLLVFLEVTKSVKSVIAMHQSTYICWLFVDLVMIF